MGDVSEEELQPLDPEIKKRLWMIRRCGWYNEEYNDCVSIRGRFHQYFVFGETLDCTQWKVDALNCFRYKDNNDIKAAKAVIDSETERRNKRLAAHFSNDIWEHRTEPPSNWNSPLPEWMEKENCNTFLAVKAKEEKEGGVHPLENRQNLCIIM